MEVLLAEIAEMVEGKIVGDSRKIIRGAASFDDAEDDEITFAGNIKFLKRVDETSAGAIIVPNGYNESSRNLIQVEQPIVAFTKILNVFHPPSKLENGIDSSVHIGRSFKCGKGVSVAPSSVIGSNVIIGDRVSIYPSVYIGDNVFIGNDVKIYSNVSVLERCRIGNRVIIHAGTVIGNDGFGISSDGTHSY